MTGLVGWWPLNEDSGSTAYDLSGNGNHGSLNGGVTQGVAGKGGLTACSFDGNDGNIINSSPSVPTGSSSRTVSFWAYIRSVSEGDGDVIAGYGSTNANEDFQLGTDYNSGSSKFVLYRFNGDYDWVTSVDASEYVGEWHHYVIEWDQKQGLEKFFIDGTHVESRNPTAPETTAGSICVGSEPDSSDRYSDVVVSDFRIYNRALSSEEVQALYEQGSGDFTTRSLSDGSDSGAVSRWKFDNSNSNASMAEDFWNSNNGNVNGASYVEDSIRSKSLQFNGSDEYVDTGLSTFTVPGTVSLWFYQNSGTDRSNHLYSNYEGTNNDFFISNSTSSELIRMRAGQNSDNTIAAVSAEEAWIHVCGVMTSSKILLYKNGVYRSSANHSFEDLGNGSDFLIGSYPYNPTGGVVLDGKIDDVRIYSRALSASEVFELYQWGTRGRDMRKLTVNSRGL